MVGPTVSRSGVQVIAGLTTAIGGIDSGQCHACPSDYRVPAVCGGQCRDLDRDATNCGRCGSTCAAFQACLGGVCVNGPGAACSADAECSRFGGVCVQSVCIAAAAPPTPFCKVVGAACSTSAQCCSGNCGSSGACTSTCSGKGEACTSGAQCCSGTCSGVGVCS
jgi:hypothetical protein